MPVPVEFWILPPVHASGDGRAVSAVAGQGEGAAGEAVVSSTMPRWPRPTRAGRKFSVVAPMSVLVTLSAVPVVELIVLPEPVT